MSTTNANPLELSDEDFLKQPMPEAVEVSDTEIETETETTEETEVEVETSAAEAEKTPEDETEGGAGEVTDEGAEEGAADEGKPEAGAEAVKDEKKDAAPETPKEESAAINYEAEYKRLIGTPIKANGRDMVIQNVDDAIQLMQMGAGFNRKMAALKPNLKLMKMLENNGLLSEEKLSYLIDLDRRVPEAINKLVKDSGLDPMDLSEEKASAYKQGTYSVDDREIELDTVLEELQTSPAYTRTLDVVSKQWDKASKQVIAAQPHLLKAINSHIENGIYDLISKEVDQERLLGRLSGLSDIEAYQQIGDRINAKGGFNHLTGATAPDQGKPTAGTKVTPPNLKKDDDTRLKDKRRAASSTKPAAPSSKPVDFNPLEMSDEEFEKQVNAKFL